MRGADQCEFDVMFKSVRPSSSPCFRVRVRVSELHYVFRVRGNPCHRGSRVTLGLDFIVIDLLGFYVHSGGFTSKSRLAHTRLGPAACFFFWLNCQEVACIFRSRYRVKTRLGPVISGCSLSEDWTTATFSTRSCSFKSTCSSSSLQVRVQSQVQATIEVKLKNAHNTSVIG